MRLHAWIISVFLWAGVGIANAIPTQITYQGTVKQNGVPVNGTQSMKFRLTTADGVTQLWSSDDMNVPVSQGLFAVTLSPSIDWQNQNPYIEVQINGNVMLPREPINATAYALMSASIVDGAVTTSKIANGAVTTNQLAANAVTSAQIAPNAITSTQIAANAVTSPQIAANAVTSTQIAANAVTSTQIAANAVTSTQIAANSITSSHITAGAVGTNQIADNAVTFSKLDPSVQALTFTAGMIMMFSGPCPTGWSRVTALDNAFPMGAPTYGTQGGSATHTHTTPNHTHQLAVTQSVFGEDSEQNYVGINETAKGTTLGSYSTLAGKQTVSVGIVSTLTTSSGGGVTGSASNIPPYVTVVYCMKQ